MKNTVKMAIATILLCTLCGCNRNAVGEGLQRPEIGSHSDDFKELTVKKDTSSTEEQNPSVPTGDDETSEPSIDVDFSDISLYTDYELSSDTESAVANFSSIEVQEGIMNRIMEFGFNRGADAVRQAIIEVCNEVDIDLRELYLIDNGVEYDTDYIYNIICMENKDKILAVAVDVKSNSVKYLFINKKG